MGGAPAHRAPSSRPPQDLVLIHGWGMNAAVWEALPEGLKAGLRLHPIELPGHGANPLRSPGGGGPGLLEAWADACLESAPAGAVWLGWSLGGLVALAAALNAARRRPGQIQGLILMTATPRFVQGPDWPAAMPSETLAQFHRGLLADPSGTLNRFLALQVRGSDQARETLRRLRQGLATRPPPDPAALALGLDLLAGQDLRQALPRLGLPTLWLFGSHDALVPPAVAGHIEGLLPGARTAVVPGAAHAPFLSHPAETTAIIHDFLDGLPERPVGSAPLGPERENQTRGPEPKRHARALFQ